MVFKKKLKFEIDVDFIFFTYISRLFDEIWMMLNDVPWHSVTFLDISWLFILAFLFNILFGIATLFISFSSFMRNRILASIIVRYDEWIDLDLQIIMQMNKIKSSYGIFQYKQNSSKNWQGKNGNRRRTWKFSQKFQNVVIRKIIIKMVIHYSIKFLK